MIQFLKKKFKKGFTLVELIVVIAIIAILAAVSVVSYVAFINKANESADQQAVSQMNLALQAGETKNKPTTIQEVYDSLAANGLEGKDYKPLYKDRYFFWDSTINRIVYTDKDYTVSYPEEYKNQANTNFYSLSGQISKEEYVSSGTVATVSNEKQLFKAVADFVSGNSINEIRASGNINMRGASLNFSAPSASRPINKDISIIGTEGSPIVISNIVNSTNHYNSEASKSYGGGIFGYFDKTITASYKIENVVIDNASVGTYESGSVGVLFDQIVDGSANINIKNVTIRNSRVYGQNKVGILIGSYRKPTTTATKKLTIGTGVVLENNTVYTVEGESGVVIGFARENLNTEAPATAFYNSLLTNVSANSTNKIEFVLDANHHKVTVGSQDYTTKYKITEPIRFYTLNSKNYVRLTPVTKTNTKYTYADFMGYDISSDKPKDGYAHNLKDTAYQGFDGCFLDYNVKEIAL